MPRRGASPGNAAPLLRERRGDASAGEAGRTTSGWGRHRRSANPIWVDGPRAGQGRRRGGARIALAGAYAGMLRARAQLASPGSHPPRCRSGRPRVGWATGSSCATRKRAAPPASLRTGPLRSAMLSQGLRQAPRNAETLPPPSSLPHRLGERPGRFRRQPSARSPDDFSFPPWRESRPTARRIFRGRPPLGPRTQPPTPSHLARHRTRHPRGTQSTDLTPLLHQGVPVFEVRGRND